MNTRDTMGRGNFYCMHSSPRSSYSRACTAETCIKDPDKVIVRALAG